MKRVRQARTKRVTLEEMRLAKNPIDRAEIRWWCIEEDRIGERRAIFYVSLPWKKHPWYDPDDEMVGAAFENDWAHEEKCEEQWRATGRSDWRHMLNLDRTAFLSKRQAQEKLLALWKTEQKHIKKRLKKIRLFIQEVSHESKGR